jgi:hypothetical protein
MSCQCNEPIDDARLLAYLDGEPDPTLQAQVDTCPDCRSRLTQLAREQGSLIDGLRWAACPPGLALGEYVLGLLSPEQRQAIAAHIVDCHRCTDAVAQTRAFLNAEVVEGVAPAVGVVERVRVLVAELFAPGPVLGLAGLRGAGDDTLTYKADDVQISLDIAADLGRPGKRSLVGLVVSPAQSELEVELWRGDMLAAMTTVDDAGNFSLDGLTPGRYSLALTSKDLEVHVKALDV